MAAHDVLLKYFPGSATRLPTRWTASLSAIPDGSREGRRRRLRRASRGLRIIQLRADDGRFGDVTFDEPEAPGVWRPTPPTFTPFFDPWLAELEPFMRASPSQFRPGPPPGLRTDVYTREFREVKRLGSLDVGGSDARTDADGAVLLRHRGRTAAGGSARPGHPARYGHQRQCAGLRRCRPQRGRRQHRVMGRETALPLVATDHRDPAREHRRESEHEPRRGLGTLDRQPALPGLPERTQPGHGCHWREPSPVCSGSDEERSTCSSRPPRRARPVTTRRRPSSSTTPWTHACGRASTSGPRIGSARRSGSSSLDGR